MIVGRRTLARTASLHGVGLHLGRACHLRFDPAPAGTGRVFVRADLPDAPRTLAHAGRAVLAERRTQLGDGPGALHTVEHVLAALVAASIDDVLITMDAPEPPICDGSAGPFLDAVLAAGSVEQAGTVDVLRLREPVHVVDGESTYAGYPCDHLELDVRIEFPHPLIGAQRWSGVVTGASFRTELAGARTFGFMHEVAALQAKGLIQGASTANAIVLDDDGVVDTTLRWPDEFVRHKAMDCVGDLALAGGRVVARIVADRPSHRGTVLLVREMLRHAESVAVA